MVNGQIVGNMSAMNRDNFEMLTVLVPYLKSHKGIMKAS